MGEGSDGLDLAEEPLGPEGHGELGPEHFDGNGAAVLQVPGEEDDRHPSLAELPFDCVALGDGGLEVEEDVGHVRSRWRASALPKSTAFAASRPENRAHAVEYRAEQHVAKLGPRHRSSVVELSIRNRAVVGSNPTGGSSNTRGVRSLLDFSSLGPPEGVMRFSRSIVALLGSVLLAGCSDSTSPAPAPTLDSVMPARGPLAGGTNVTITGNNLSGVNSVTIGGKELIDRHVVSATMITGTAPAATTAGAADVVVTAGTSGSGRCPGCFTYVGLAVLAVGPTASPVSGGLTVTITGTNFVDVTSVTIGGTQLGSSRAVSPTEITGVAPALSAGSKDVVVSSSAYGTGTCAGCILYMPDELLAPPVVAGSYHTCQVNAGSASCWGDNLLGQLGNGSAVNEPAPV